MRRGFTLLELTVVLAILGFMMAPFGMLLINRYRDLRDIGMVAGLRQQSDDVGLTVMRLAAGGGAWHLDADNHGVTFANGNQVRWRSRRLLLREHGQSHDIPYPDVQDVMLVRHGQVLSVTVDVARPPHVGRRPVEAHQTYDYPSVALR